VDVRERQVLYYLPEGRAEAPFRAWRDGIADQRTKLAITARIARLRGGNFGDSKPIGDGASENRINFGPGYRIYYGIDGADIILLLGGDKSSQRADIQQARRFWLDYKERRREQKRKL
jgi:putative addiction module killer protein